MSDVLKKLTREMEKVQEPKRFVHTQGVEYNRVRQAAITQEITEISAGAAAQRGTFGSEG